MRTLPTTMVQVLAPFVPLFLPNASQRHAPAASGRCDLGSRKENRSSPRGGELVRREVLLPLPSGLKPSSRGRAGKQAAYTRVAQFSFLPLRVRS